MLSKSQEEEIKRYFYSGMIEEGIRKLEELIGKDRLPEVLIALGLIKFVSNKLKELLDPSRSAWYTEEKIKGRPGSIFW